MGLICLQGGAEHTAPCAEMDAALLDGANARGAVVVAPLASETPAQYAGTAANALRYWRDLGATASAAPDPRDGVAATVAAIAAAELLVLPGGSPARALAVLDGAVGQAVLAHVARGGAVSGSSAGAMVLCAWSLLPEGRSRALAPGLAAVRDLLVVPHFRRGQPGWVDDARRLLDDAAEPDVDVLAIPECSGVLVTDDALVAVGREPSLLVTRDGEHELVLAADTRSDVAQDGPG